MHASKMENMGNHPRLRAGITVMGCKSHPQSGAQSNSIEILNSNNKNNTAL